MAYFQVCHLALQNSRVLPYNSRVIPVYNFWIRVTADMGRRIFGERSTIQEFAYVESAFWAGLCWSRHLVS